MGLRNFTIIGRKIIGLDAKYVKDARERMEIFANAEKFLFLKPTSSYVAEPKAIRLPASFDAKCAGILVDSHDCDSDIGNYHWKGGKQHLF